MASTSPLNESPSEKEGKYYPNPGRLPDGLALNESPSEKEGKSFFSGLIKKIAHALNESPSEKEGKFRRGFVYPHML